MTLPRLIAPSLLAGDFACLGEECDHLLAYGADWLHIDIMDGHFVPNLTIGPPVVQSIRRHCPTAFLDCHMMVDNPNMWVEVMGRAGASQYTFHLEAVKEVGELLSLIKKIKENGMRVGIAIRPDTPLSDLLESGIIDSVDMVLIMTVQPGFGGQPLRRECLEKVHTLRKLYGHLNIQVDGGITMDNLGDAVTAGANVIVAGTLILGSEDSQSTIHQMKSIMETHAP